MKKGIRLGVNIDHVATIRQARGTHYPDPVMAAQIAIEAGADGITLHLREDRRHIQEQDLVRLKENCSVPINLEMAVTEEMLTIAEQYLPEHCCLVPEKREELTTEGGLDVVAHEAEIKSACERLARAGIEVSLFIDPEATQIDAAIRCGAPVIELHTGQYAEVVTDAEKQHELQRLENAARYAHEKGLLVNAGHGLHFDNIEPIVEIPHLNELNIGHSLIAEAIFEGIFNVVKKMKQCL